ncbi:gluconokinase [Lentzea kentuckyensis]|uniref:gluconokinase n=1 Tax=Lentzea kentuckyensis TaxID=360086 RepID=UPI000A3BCC57|nr:gluconokinase [Lentzea kentuckyensis]
MSGPATQVVLGIDIGTTAVKVVAVDRDLAVRVVEERECRLTGADGRAEHDAEHVLCVTVGVVRQCVASCAEIGLEVAGLSFSAALHTLLALDDKGEPLTPALSWADTRATAVARRIRAEGGAELHRSTGTPVHPMSPLTKLAWFAQEEPGLLAGAAVWCGLKDFVLFWFTDRLVTDLSCASATGLLDLSTMDWSADAIEVSGVDVRRLPELVAPTEVLTLCADAADALGLPAGLPVVAGAGDGPLANLGVGAVVPGTAALSVGTSAALRVARTGPAVDERCRVFCYHLAGDLWVTGGAVSNGGLVAQWAMETFGLDDIGELLAEAALVPPGADGLVALPYLLGERAPWWDPSPRGAFMGLRGDHDRAAMTRAMVEGVGQQIALVRDSVLETGARVDVIRATGGALRAPLWADVLAAALDLPLEVADDSAGSGFGAALLAWHALGVLPSLAAAAQLPRTRRTVWPDSVAAARMAAVRPLIEQIHEVATDLAAIHNDSESSARSGGRAAVRS